MQANSDWGRKIVASEPQHLTILNRRCAPSSLRVGGQGITRNRMGPWVPSVQLPDDFQTVEA